MDQSSAANDAARIPGHWLLARLGKRVLRPGGMELTRKLLGALGITEDDDVLEFAPGMGATAQIVLAGRLRSYVAVERDEAAAQRLRGGILAARSSAVSLVIGSAEDARLPTGSADVVFEEAMLTMQRDDVKRQIIREACRLLRAGGRYGIHEMSLLDEHAKAAVERSLSGVIHHGVRPLTVPGWETLLREEHFDVREIHAAPMHLLEPLRLVRDEGWAGAFRFAWNVIRDHEARRRVLAMRGAFRRHGDQIAAVAIVAVKKG